MPAPIILPRAPDTSLSNLGGVILGGVNDMADRKLAADREARLRAERLMDVQEQRDYNEQMRGVVRAEELADEQKWKPSAEAMAARLSQDEKVVRGQMETLAAEMGAPPSAPTQAEVLGRARQLWSAANPGKAQPTTPEKLAAEIAQAQDELQERSVQSWQVKQLSGREIFKNLKERLDSIDASRRSLINLRVFEPQGVAGAAPAAQTPVLPSVDLDAARAAARAKAIAAPATPTSTAPQSAATPSPASRGLAGLVEAFTPERSVLSYIPEIAETGARVGTGALMGGLTGDFTPPERSIFSRAGEALGGFLAGDPRIQSDDDRVLIEQPHSPKALEIRRRRSQEAARRALLMAQPTNAPDAFTPAAANPLRGLVAP